MARTRICRSRRCEVCAELPDDNPLPPTAESNVLIAMRDRRIREQAERERLIAQAPGAAWAIAEGQARNLPTVSVSVEVRGESRPLDVCPVPTVEGITWAAVQRLVAHAWTATSSSSICAKRVRDQADFGRPLAPNWCRECQAAVLRMLGRNVYVAGNEIRERGSTGTRKLARAERGNQ